MLIVIMVVVMAAAMLTVLMVMLVMVVMVVMMLVLVLIGMGLVCLNGLGQQLGHQITLAVHHRKNLLAVQLLPVGGHNGSGGVLFLQHGHGGSDLFFVGAAGAAQDNAAGVADLVIVELAEVLHIHFDLFHIGHRDKAVQLHRQLLGHALHRTGHIAQLAHARGLDQNTVGGILLHHLAQCLAEIAHQAAADAAGVQLVDLNTGLLQKSAVDADLAKFIFDQNDLLALKSFPDQLFDQRGFACAQKSGKNIDFRCFLHNNVPAFHLKIYHCGRAGYPWQTAAWHNITAIFIIAGMSSAPSAQKCSIIGTGQSILPHPARCDRRFYHICPIQPITVLPLCALPWQSTALPPI